MNRVVELLNSLPEEIKDRKILSDPRLLKFCKGSPYEELKRISDKLEEYDLNKDEFSKEKQQLDLISRNVFYTPYIGDPTERVQLEVINKNPLYIALIKNPTEKVQLEAVKLDPTCINCINNPTEKVQLEVINKTLQICVICKKNKTVGRYNRFCSEQCKTEAGRIAEENLKKNTGKTRKERLEDPMCMNCINDPTEKEQLEAVKCDPTCITLFKNPTERVQLEVINKNPLYCMLIKNPTEKVQLEIIKKTPDYIRRVMIPTCEQWLAFLNSNN